MFRPVFTRSMSFKMFERWGYKCEKNECKDTEPASKYVVQKTCCPSIFESWKPKIPDLNSNNLPTIQKSMMSQYQPKTCTAGMKILEKSRCEIEAAAKICQKVNHPKWVQFCPPIPKSKIVEQNTPSQGDEALPPLQAALVNSKKCKDTNQKPADTKSLRKKLDPEVPEGDWNPDGHLC